jgi:hypothetical protein
LPEKISLEAPALTYLNGHLEWSPVKEAINYRLFKNGQEIGTSSATRAAVNAAEFGEYQVVALAADGYESFASEPVMVYPPNFEQRINLENIVPQATLPYQGFSGQGFVEISKHKNTHLSIPVNIPQAGVYALDFRYANGNGPISTDNKCAIRTLRKDNLAVGTLVFPQRGTGEWSEWGYSNQVQVSLEEGPNTLLLTFEEHNENMNGAVNQAMLDYMRVIKIK